MKKTKIKVYKLALPLKESSYKWSHNTDFNSYNSITYTKGSPQRVNGKMQASDNNGLGVKINESLIGDPLITIE